MKLAEKILELRKRHGLSQEALAELLGVSRQAISKWENGDATPEIFKIRLIAETFDVTSDWLLSEEGFIDPIRKLEKNNQGQDNKQAFSPDWVDHLPKSLGNLIRKFGWLAGVYVIMAGVGPMVMGGLSIFMTNRMFGHTEMDSFFMDDPMSVEMLANNPVRIMGKFMIGVGIILVILGIVLTIALRRWGKKEAKASTDNSIYTSFIN